MAGEFHAPTGGSTEATRGSSGPALVRISAATVGAVFLLIGVLGFIPGVTTGYDRLGFAGHASGAELFGVFQVSVLHNLVHLAFGLAGIALARTVAGSRGFLVGGGAVYLLLWLYGLVIGHETAANFLPLNRADDWLHFGLGLGMIGLGLLTTRAPVDR
ncbi:DUF4383 domain-containing protein [Micromonospora sp. NBC_01796]|uniref:DUF4383 domain-containing protein n=1 Tax=Micromonospora sp. NBC_01796 TaxID=2975987 RepID=UPI002DDBB440|nr:DUF4383 domain-containing protein [Micromonospora sp. NBC_01796]WSA85370.1 DUF4383 domain-containing protein [Micromonospora sp. NBC_01796]